MRVQLVLGWRFARFTVWMLSKQHQQDLHQNVHTVVLVETMTTTMTTYDCSVVLYPTLCKTTQNQDRVRSTYIARPRRFASEYIRTSVVRFCAVIDVEAGHGSLVYTAYCTARASPVHGNIHSAKLASSPSSLDKETPR